MDESRIYLDRSGTHEVVEAELWDDISDLHLDMWRSTWFPMITQAKSRLQRAGVPHDKWPQDLHWRWDEKTDWSRGLLALQRFAITCGGALQGLMLVNLTKLTARLPSQRGKDLAYVDFVSTAPWNRPDIAGVMHYHPSPRFASSKNNPANPCRHFISSDAFAAMFSGIDELSVFQSISEYILPKKGGPVGKDLIVLTDDNGNKHEFGFETFNFGYECLTLAVHLRKLPLVIGVL